jgi:hydrogenase maturation protease
VSESSPDPRTEPAADEAARRRVLIGVGNLDRGDDAAGRLVARSLAGALPAEVDIVECCGNGADLLELLEDAAAAVVVDACASGAPAGTVHRFDAGISALPTSRLRATTHGFGPAEALELGRALGRLPGRCTVYAIEARRFGPGEPLSPAVGRAVRAAAARILADAAETFELAARPRDDTS